MSIAILPGGPPVSIELPTIAGAVVTNYGPGTVSYSDSQDVRTNPEGSIASGATATLYGTTWFAASDGASIDVRTLDGGSVEERLQAVESRRLDQVPAPDAEVDLAAQKIVNLADPDDPQDAATRAYVLANAGGDPFAETAEQSFPSRLTTTRPVSRVTEDAFAAHCVAEIQAYLDWHTTAGVAAPFVGELSWPNNSPYSIYNATDDPARWNALGANLMRMMMEAGAWVAFWQADEVIAFNSGSAYSPLSRTAMGPLAQANAQAAVLEGVYVPDNGARVGVGLSTAIQGFPEGGASSSTGWAGHVGPYSFGFSGAMDQTYDAGRVNDNPYARRYNYGSQATYEFLGSRPNITFVRLPVRWERIQPVPGAALDSTEMGRIDQALAWAAAAGIGVVFDIHNSGSYYVDNGSGTAGVRQSIGGATVTQAHFVDLWQRLSALYKTDARVIAYDLMNEPSIGPATNWTTIAQAAINAIRALGDTKLLMLQVQAGTTEFIPSLTPPFTDSAANLRYQGHYYCGQFPTYPDSYATVNAVYAAQGWKGSLVKGGVAGPVLPPPNASKAANAAAVTRVIDQMEAAGLIPARVQASDTFTRADSAVSLTSPWIPGFAGIGVQSNKAYPIGPTGTPQAVVSTRLADCVVRASVTLSATRSFVGLSGRVFGTTNAIYVVLNKTGTQDRIFLSVNPAASTLVSLPAAGLVAGQTYDVQLRMVGSLIEVYLDSVLKLSHTLSAPNLALYGTQKNHGLYMILGADPFDDGGSRWDNFQVLSDVLVAVPDAVTVATYAADHTLAVADIDKVIEMDSASANRLLLPTDTAVAIPVGSEGRVDQIGVGLTTVEALYGVTVRRDAGRAATGTRYASGRWRKRAANDFMVYGDIAATPYFEPSQLGGLLQGWIKADSETPVADGTAVVPTERSGSGLTVTQATGSAQPLYKTNILNGLPAYQFDGVDDQLLLSTLAALTAGEVFLIVKANNDPGVGIKALWRLGTEPTNSGIYPWTDGQIYEEFGTTVRKTVGNPTPSLSSAFRLYNVISAAGEFTVNLDGTQLFTTATNTVGFPAAPTLGKGIGATFFAGQWCEWVLLNAKASTTQRAHLKAYFASKFALTIA